MVEGAKENQSIVEPFCIPSLLHGESILMTILKKGFQIACCPGELFVAILREGTV